MDLISFPSRGRESHHDSRLTDEPTRKIVGDLLTALAKAVVDQRLLKSATR